MTSGMPSCLADARELVDPELRKAVERLDAGNRRVVEYHFGWVDAAGAPSGGGGKALRPAMALLSAGVGGAAADRAVAAATAVELVHNFSLLHDDVMDGDTERRHRPTAWTVFGSSAAVLAGDALLTLATKLLLEDPSSGSAAATRSLLAATEQLIAGQSADLDFEQRLDVTLQECLAMAAGKTGALMACSSSIGAVLVGAGTDTVEGMWAFGAELGLAFQLVDDLLGLWGDPATTGKPVLSDLRCRKKSVPVVHALTSGTAEGTRLGELYAQPEPLDEGQLHEAAELVARAGSQDWTRAECEKRLALAEQHLERVAPPGPAAEALTELASFIVTRKL
jgi:geranylgeranyl diphosphate synthase type I